MNASPVVYNTDVEGHYFQTLGLHLLAGRLLTAQDRQGSELVAVVNRSFGKAFWSSKDSLDRRFKFGPPSVPGPWVRIVGVIADSTARSPDQPAEPRIYVPLDQDPYAARAMRQAWFVLRAEGDALTLKPSVQDALVRLIPLCR